VDNFPGPRLLDKGGGLVFSTHCKGWGGWVFEIGSVDHATAPNTTNISFSKGGWQEARGCTGMGSFFVSHRLELLTQPGEWAHDEKGGYLYLGIAPDSDSDGSSSSSSPNETTTLYGPSISTVFSVQGTQARYSRIQEMVSSLLFLFHYSQDRPRTALRKRAFLLGRCRAFASPA
jgi:hypothetical protein